MPERQPAAYPSFTEVFAPPRRDVAQPVAAVLTLRQAAFSSACGDLMRLVEQDFPPTLLVGVGTGGMFVANEMARAAASETKILPLMCRRPGTRLKAKIPGLKTILSSLPEPLLNVMRHVEHKLGSGRRRTASAPTVNQAEAEAIGAWLNNARPNARVVIADDAVDSGLTLATVTQTLRQVCPPSTQLRSAVLTVTLRDPVMEPEYTLYREVLCRFPWSFDAAI